MSVMEWKRTPFWADEGEKGPQFRRTLKRQEEVRWRKEALEDMEEWELDNE